jgi:hypothetical protein
MKNTSLIFLLNFAFGAAIAASPEIEDLRKRAENGDLHAQFKLGAAYDWGSGVERNGAETIKWYQRAAEGGLAEAQNSLGSTLQAEKKYSDAFIWYEKAALQNLPIALSNLGFLYRMGLGVQKDTRRAKDLYMSAANLGEAEAMFNLGQMLSSGELGEKDLESACSWAYRARKYAPSEHVKLLKAANSAITWCKSTLTEEQNTRSITTTNDWKPKSISQNVQMKK